MLYQWYAINNAAVKPARAAAGSYRMFFENPFNPLAHTAMGRSAAAACEVLERITRVYDKPEFGLRRTQVDGAEVGIEEEIAWRRPFCRLIHFKRDICDERAAQDPRILLVAPMSGHYATLLRGTVEALLPHYEVYITDWQDASEVPQGAGSFDLDDYIIYMSDLFRHFGGDVHVLAVCQPSVPVLAAVALMEAEDDPHVPASMTLMGGPIDTRVSKTAVNKMAEDKGTDWFARNVLQHVPWGKAGANRLVYPGFLQLGGFVSMNLNRHVKAHKDMFFHLIRGDGDSAEKHREFYDEYLAVMDLTAEFYIQTIDQVFVNHQLARGVMHHRGRLIDLSAIKRVALLTVEGEKDDITGIGQCAAAHGLCDNIPAANKLHFECPGVGHYGIFNGRRFRSEIVPRILNFTHGHDSRAPELHAMPAKAFKVAGNGAANGGGDIGAGVFSFAKAASAQLAPANDAAPDRLAQKVKARGHQAIGNQSLPLGAIALAAPAAVLRFWGMTFSILFSAFGRMQRQPGGADTR